jgi:chorismate-pyruvate lyase
MRRMTDDEEAIVKQMKNGALDCLAKALEIEVDKIALVDKDRMAMAISRLFVAAATGAAMYKMDQRTFALLAEGAHPLGQDMRDRHVQTKEAKGNA